jgi:flagellar basal-body rod protein FlgG
MFQTIKRIGVTSLYATTVFFAAGLVFSSFAGHRRVPRLPQQKHFQIVSAEKDSTSDHLEYTAGSLDIAIDGQGFFQVRLPWTLDGTGYTRNGSLLVNRNGDLVVGVGDGYRLMPPINLPYGAKDITFKPDGGIQFTDPSTGRITGIATLRLAQFANPQGLKCEGDGIYTATDTSGPAILDIPGEHGAGQIRHGFLEIRNDDPSKELAQQRPYTNAASPVQTAAHVQQPAANLKHSDMANAQ